MSFQSWWRQKSRRSKTITIMATFLILEIGLCFGTPVGVGWSDALLGTHMGRDPFSSLGYMFVEAVVAVIVFLVFIGVVIFYRPAAGQSPTTSITAAENDQQPRDDGDRSQS